MALLKPHASTSSLDLKFDVNESHITRMLEREDIMYLKRDKSSKYHEI